MGIEITVRRYNNNYCTAISASWCNTFFTSYLNPQSVYMLCKGENLEEYNPLNLNSHLLPLFISYRSSGEKLIIKISSKFILCDHVRNSHDHSVLQSIDISRRNLMLITLKA